MARNNPVLRIASRGSQAGRQAEKPPRNFTAGNKSNPPRGSAAKAYKSKGNPNGQSRHK